MRFSKRNLCYYIAFWPLDPSAAAAGTTREHWTLFSQPSMPQLHAYRMHLVPNLRSVVVAQLRVLSHPWHIWRISGVNVLTCFVMTHFDSFFFSLWKETKARGGTLQVNKSINWLLPVNELQVSTNKWRHGDIIQCPGLRVDRLQQHFLIPVCFSAPDWFFEEQSAEKFSSWTLGTSFHR